LGNNDWNVYCFAEKQATISTINFKIGSSKIILGEQISGFGQLNPNFPNQSIHLSFLKPDESIITLQQTTSRNGEFAFDYTPDIIGDWIITASWESDKSYYTSVNNASITISIESPNEVELSAEHVFLLVISIIILVTVIGSIIIFKKQKKKQ
jgi:hypothetical protein